MVQKTAIVIGAGPAGLTAAYELLHTTDVVPHVYEATFDIGGICKTVDYNGNKIDIGGHRFFSKSQRVMDWWENILPLQGYPSRDDDVPNRQVSYSTKSGAPDPETEDRVMLVRQRISRILFQQRFFEYPLSMSLDTVSKLGLSTVTRIGLSYLRTRLLPIKNERSLEDFFINRFGRQLYRMFFETYTEKVWGIPCRSIKPEWGAQRIKGLSMSRAVVDAVRRFSTRGGSLRQLDTETSLIRQFLYPKYGPGQMWEEVSRAVEQKGGTVSLGKEIVGLDVRGDALVGVRIKDVRTGDVTAVTGDFVISSMPIRDLVKGLGGAVSKDVREIADGLVYRDFITVGLLVDRLMVRDEGRLRTRHGLIRDNWIYVQEPSVKLGRIQIFNNWSPYLVRDDTKAWLGLEYFCTEGDSLWCRSDEEIIELCIDELETMEFAERDDVLDGVVIRMPKAYPAYFGTYDRFDLIREFLDRFTNLFLIGRNGMHRYNNQDHSMLTAMVAVENIGDGITTKDNLWDVNAAGEYHEGT